MTIRSKHNNLLNFFIYDKKRLSKKYVKKCEKLLNEIEIKKVTRKEQKNETRYNL